MPSLLSAGLVLAVVVCCLPGERVVAGQVAIVNPGFEDVTGQFEFNEFTFAPPMVGWDIHDPNGIVPDGTVYVGTLQPNGVEFFNGPAPEGTRVSILFNSGREGDGEYGFFQELDEPLQAGTEYRLSVEVGNIASGTATNNVFYNLDEFPGYRVELMVETGTPGVFHAIATDNNSLVIPEGEFATSTVTAMVAADHPFLGNHLAIRLVNLNVIPDGYTQQTSPDLEVDFDDVTLTASPVIPATIALTDPAGLPELSFATSALNTYSIRAADTPDGPFVEIDQVAGTGGTVSYIDLRPMAQRQFYRVFEE